MKTISSVVIYEYLKKKCPDISDYLKNGSIDKRADKSIGVFIGSDTRGQNNIAIGGVECTTVRMLPINIIIHWTQNQKVCDDKAIEIFDALLCEDSNFFVGDVKIATIFLLDPCPIQQGRDEKNICEDIIRANFYYYV